MPYDKARVFREKAIINSAKKCFLKKGITSTTVKDISEEAGISRQTFYKYYESIDKLFSEIYRESQNHLITYITEYTENACTYEFLRSVLVRLLEFSTVYADEILCISALGKFVSNSNICDKYYCDYFKNFILQGQKNGEIRTDADANILTAVFVNTLLGLAQQIVVIRKNLGVEYNITPTDFINGAYDMLKCYFSPKQ